MLERLYRLGVGRVEDYGLPKPDHAIGEAHPTVSADFLNRIVHGEVTWHPNIARIEPDAVVFEDGARVEADVIVWCTGYKVTFPFFDEELISAPDNDLPLFRRVLHPDHATSPSSGCSSRSARSCRWPRRRAAGSRPTCAASTACPAASEMRADIERERKRMFKRYVASKRHTMQVDFESYLWELGKELKARRRARPRGRLRAAGAARARAQAVAA